MDDLDLQLTMQMMLEEEESEEDEDEVRQAASAGLLIYAGAEESRQLQSARRSSRRTYLTRAELLPNPRENTAWQILYNSQSDRAFITTMGFNIETFHSILDAGFAAEWNTRPIPRNDVQQAAVTRPACRSLDAAGALGLILHFLTSTMGDVSLMEIFALIPTTVSQFINFSLTILLQTLRKMPDAQIKWLQGEEFEENNNLILARHPLLLGAFGSMDGLNLLVQTSPDQEIENATYNGWLHEHFVSSVFAFSATGFSILS
jgi:hypothetical protein